MTTIVQLENKRMQDRGSEQISTCVIIEKEEVYFVVITDSLYGTFKLEPVLETLIASPPVQRLKKIHQAGGCFLAKPEWNVTRYEHSIGAMLLVRKLGGGMEEQIAALLHDLSHTAFSHVIDYVLSNKDEDYHESLYERLVKETNIPELIDKAGYNAKSILFSTKEWSLLDRDLPHLCVDRIDYTLRDLYSYGWLSLGHAHGFLNQLVVVDGYLVCEELRWAEWFASMYFKETIEFFLHPTNVFANQQLAHILSVSLEAGVLSLDDFVKTDFDVLKKLQMSQNKTIQTLLTAFEKPLSPSDFQLREKQIQLKIRVIDPDVRLGARCLPASTQSTVMKELFIQTKKAATTGAIVTIAERGVK